MASQITTNTNLSKEELNTLIKVSKDPFLFSTYCYVVHPVRGKVPFLLYPYQKSTLYHFLKNRFNIILKFRQAGITELMSLYSLWLTMYHPNKKVNIISIKDTTAKKVLKKIKFMYKNLPWYLQTPIINGRSGEFGSASMIEFSNGSFIESIPTSTEAGRSESLSLLIIDEAAIVRWASQIWQAAFPTLSTGGSAIINSCVTGDTPIIGKEGNFRIEQVCPKEFGVQDIRFMNLKVLTHKGRWRRALYGVNKGVLETWEVKDCKNQIIKCTPAHKFFTIKGWKPLEEIVKEGLYVIQYNLGLSELENPPITKPPKEEILKEIKGFPSYLVSNKGYVIYKKDGSIKKARKNLMGYYRIKLWNRGDSKTFTLSKLVAEAFIGKVPEGYVVDHIDCNIEHNYVTNLQIISSSENAKRAVKYSRGLKLNTRTGEGAPDLLITGYILYLYHIKKIPQYKIAEKLSKKFKCDITKTRVCNCLKRLNTRTNGIYISQLEVLKKYSDNIYDITVEEDESYITTTNYVSHNTPYGLSNWYHSTWVDALSGGNTFTPLRLYWRMHPERDDQWYKEMSQALGPKRTAQEIDGDFLGSGNSVFDLTDIKAIEDNLSEYPILKTRFNGQYRQFSEPDLTKEYFIGADIASGRATDYSAFACMDREGEEHAIYKGRMPIDKFARLLGDTGILFNNATIAPESNDIGLAVTSFLQQEGYPRLYYYQKMIRKKGKHKPEVGSAPGWLTTQKNRSIIIDQLENDIRNDMVIIKDPFFVNEAYTFIYDSLGRPVAMGKHRPNNSTEDLDFEIYSDDDIMATSITNHIRKGRTNLIVNPQ